ncbi:MAG: hypothetical protein JOY64_09895 [Alphaproteobacteria bacterium]|nr:hypothetical protein [Alphaproteobacteria bacterium]MBV8407932.1 hypothetical protein [Alphaproteobacteria bacterium]
MDTAYISAFPALGGSAVGAFASLTTTWLTLNSQERANPAAGVVTRRENLYGEFIEEVANALADGPEDAPKFVHIYALITKMRLFASRDVLAEVEGIMLKIVQTYDSPEKDFQRSIRRPSDMDILRAFGEACRRELKVNL